MSIATAAPADATTTAEATTADAKAAPITATPPPSTGRCTSVSAPPFSMETSAFPAHPAPPPELRGARTDPEPVTVVDTECALRRAARDETEQIGDRIAELAAHLHAATYRMLVLLADFDRRGGWWTGFRTCAEWLSWRTGIGPGAAREKVRVARALVDLPLLSEAMAGGEVSYSKLRALTRVATPENEGELLDFARAGTAAHVERLVRTWRRVDRWEEAEAEKVRHQARHLSVYPDDDGMMVIRGRLDPEVGAVLRKALEAAEDQLYRKRKREDAAGSGEEADGCAGGAGGSGAADGSGEEVTGSGEEEAGPEDATTPDLPDLPEPTAGQRRADALGLLAEAALGRGLADGKTSGTRAERYQVVLHVDADTLAADGTTARGVMDHDVGVSAETCRRLSCDAGLVTMLHGADPSPAANGARRILDVGRKTRTIPPAIRRALDARDKGCVFPGCCGLSFTTPHHIIHWADGGPTSLDNLLLLCRFHHRVVHEGGWRVEFTPGEKPRFHRPEGGLLPRVPPAPPLPSDPVTALVQKHHDHGVEPGPWTATPSWRGERLDLHFAVPLFREWSAAQARKARERAGDSGSTTSPGPSEDVSAETESARVSAKRDTFASDVSAETESAEAAESSQTTEATDVTGAPDIADPAENVSAGTPRPNRTPNPDWYRETSPGTPIELLDIYG